MLASSRERILEGLGDEDVVLDVGAWAHPFPRADWVLDLLPHATRGLYYYDRETAEERFSRETWVQRDICDREPWPFADDQFDFAICSHTLEDVRDPVYVCSELSRVARAGYIEVPSRLEEHSLGVHGPWAGWSHHHWLCEVSDGRLDVVFKTHAIHHPSEFHFPAGFQPTLSEEERVLQLWWEGGVECREHVHTEAETLEAYLRDFVASHADRPAAQHAPRRRFGRR